MKVSIGRALEGWVLTGGSFFIVVPPNTITTSTNMTPVYVRL